MVGTDTILIVGQKNGGGTSFAQSLKLLNKKLSLI